MEPSDRRPSAAAPSLISGGSTRSSAHEPTRILASLEGRAGAASSLPRRTSTTVGIAAVTLILVGGAVIAGVWSLERERARPSRDDPAAVIARGETVPAPAADGMTGVHPAEAAPAAAAAAIVNLPPTEAQAAAPPVPTQAPAPPPPASSPQAGAVRAAIAPRKTVVAHRAPAPRVARKNAETLPRTHPGDADVDLLAAMISHMNNPPTDPVAARTMAGGASLRANVARRDAADAASNAVARTTEEQIAQCDALGFFEARLCRLRVCAGRFGKDAACSSDDTQPAAAK